MQLTLHEGVLGGCRNIHRIVRILLIIGEELLKEHSEAYANAIHTAGAPLSSCDGFTDCTRTRMTRPGGNGTLQQVYYSGHKRMHCLVYQTITTPDGFLFALYGPKAGRRHYLTLLRDSGWEDVLETCLNINSRQFYVYGDCAYLFAAVDAAIFRTRSCYGSAICFQCCNEWR